MFIRSPQGENPKSNGGDWISPPHGAASLPPRPAEEPFVRHPEERCDEGLLGITAADPSLTLRMTQEFKS